jgi:hypothetical protein
MLTASVGTTPLTAYSDTATLGLTYVQKKLFCFLEQKREDICKSRFMLLYIKFKFIGDPFLYSFYKKVLLEKSICQFRDRSGY